MRKFAEYSILINNMLTTIVLKNFASRKKYKPGAAVSVNRGYGRYLIKQGYVLSKTVKNEKVANNLLAEEGRKKEAKIQQAKLIKESLEKENISFVVTNCNGNGILFGAISVKDILKKLHSLNKLYISIKAHEVLLKKAIKTYGVYESSIFLYEDIEARVMIYVGNSNDQIGKMINNQHKLNSPEEITEETKKTQIEEKTNND